MVSISAKAAEDCAHSKTLREVAKPSTFRQVLECAQSSAAFAFDVIHSEHF
jgi:hypothetical protein